MAERKYDIAPYAEIDIPRQPDAYTETPVADTSGWSIIVTSANVLLAIILIVGMLFDGQSIVLSIITGAAYYFLSTVTVVGLASGQLSTMWRAWLVASTEKHRVDAYEYLAERKMELDAPQTVQTVQPVRQLPADPVQTPTALPHNYVPAYTAQAVGEAWEWVSTLYDSAGMLDMRRVRKGYIQGEIVGSKRHGGNAEALELLRSLNMVAQAKGGYVFNVKRYPTLDHASAEFAKLQGAGGGWETDSQG